MSVDIKIGGSINDINLSNNAVDQKIANNFFKDSIAPGNALGGNIIDTVAGLTDSKVFKFSIGSLKECLTEEFFVKFGKNGIMDSKVFYNNITDPKTLPDISVAKGIGIFK